MLWIIMPIIVFLGFSRAIGKRFLANSTQDQVREIDRIKNQW